MKRMERIRGMAAAGLLTVLAFTACGKQEEAPIPSRLDDGVLTVGLLNTEDRSCYPIRGEDGALTYAGWEIEVLKLVDFYMEDAEVELKMVDSREELLSLLNTGGIDLAAGAFTRLDTYETQYMISDDYGYGSIYLVNQRNGYIDTLAAYEDAVIGVSTQLPVTDVGKLTGIENVTQNQYADMATLAADIESGVVAAGLCTESEMVKLVSGTDMQAAELHGASQSALVFLAPLGQDYLMRWINWGIDRHYYEMALGIDSTQEEETGGF